MADELYPDVAKIVVVLDNLNTHVLAAYYLAFEPYEARRLIKRSELHRNSPIGASRPISTADVSKANALFMYLQPGIY